MSFPIMLAGVAAALGIGDPPTPATMPAAMPSAPAAPSADDPQSTALALRDDDQRMTVAVTIDGAGPFRFIVDSGATRTVISGRLAALLKLPPAGTVLLHSVGGEMSVPTVHIGALTLSGLAARPIDAPVLDEENLGAEGILGIDALAGKKVVIDLPGNRMTIEPSDRSEARAAGDEIVVTARRRFGQLVLVDAAAAGEHIYAVLDTGSMVTIANAVLQARLVRRRRVTPQPVFITDVTGRSVAAFYAPVSDIRLSDWHLHGTQVAFSDAHCFRSFGLSDKPSMLLGMDMMRAFQRVSIDFKRRTVRLLRRDERSAVAPNFLSVGPG